MAWVLRTTFGLRRMATVATATGSTLALSLSFWGRQARGIIARSTPSIRSTCALSKDPLPPAPHPRQRQKQSHPRLVSKWQNPGVRATKDIVSGEEEEQLIAEVKDLISKYGCSHIDDKQEEFYRLQMKHLAKPPPVNMMRVTGRVESEEQRLAPWGYGDGFDETKVPPMLRMLLERVKNHPEFSLGSPRDITLNYRHSTFFRLDPHLDPELDGGNIFIIGLNSDAVLTLVPPTCNMNFALQNQERVSTRSWHPGDIDILIPRRGMAHLHDAARSLWKHGMRLGISPSSQLGDSRFQDPHEQHTSLCCWFGSSHHLVPRANERFSIVFAFADKK